MGKIIVLDENTANKIAAGEVVERPASVIKELVENSIDAGATGINVEIRNGGISFIRVIDNGSGLAEDDVEMAFERHATSKIRRADDLEFISSMGFRGEALASIAAVSDVQMSTRVKSAVQGISIEVKGGCILNVKPAGCPIGTSITVKELFFNTPARYKFLKKDSTEAGYIADILSRIALGYPDISIKLVNNGTVLLHTPGNGDLKSAIFSIYGAETAKHLIEVHTNDGKVEISGFVGKAELSRSNRNQQSIYINRRYIRSKTISAAIDSAYATFLMKNRYAFALLDIRLNTSLVDVNVHPSKMEVKFSSEQDIYRAVYNAVNSALLSHSSIRTLANDNRHEKNSYNISEKAAFNLSERVAEKPAYTQQEFELIKKALDQKRDDAISGENRNNDDSKAKNYKMNEAIGSEHQYLAEGVSEQRMYTGIKSEPKQQETNVSEQQTYTGSDSESQQHTAIPTLYDGTRIIGQAFSTYILLERGEELFLIDQHAAHERIRYEELKKAFEQNQPIYQTLLAVLPVELTCTEYQFAINEASFFEKLGITYESFGTNSIILRTVPFNEKEIDVKKLFLEILDFVMSGNNGQKGIIADETLYTMACKSAVKAHKKLNEKEIEALLNLLANLENPYTCPHGRPAILRLRKYELEKIFKRIV